MNFMFKSFFVAMLFLTGCSVGASETYWLTHIAAPFQVQEKIFPNLENPADKTGDVSVITIKNGLIVFNGEWCNYEIEKIMPFIVDRTLSDTIDDFGGLKNFDLFLKKNFKTSVSSWRFEYFVRKSDKYLDSLACQLLQNGSIYRDDKGLIIWDSVYFYRFLLGKDFKY